MSGKQILLVEPKSATSYPPLGLMKFSTYHKLKGDEVKYVTGLDKKASEEFWDKIYVTSVFTYDFNSLIKTIQYYSKNLYNFDNLAVGGISASLLADEVYEKTGIKPQVGIRNEIDPFLVELAKKNPDFAYLNDCGPSIDNLPPDYSIFPSPTKYSKILDNAYFFFSTKGCPNRCGFCAVGKLEPDFVEYIPLKPRIDYITQKFGGRAGLLLLDNNIAHSPSYDRIIDEIKDCGFEKGASFKYKNNGRTISKKRFVDFNQGVDLRKMTKEKMSKMAEIAISPLRLAFDDILLREQYEEKMRLAIDCGIENLSNYMLYNYKDTPNDLYERMIINTGLKKEHENIKIFSFPMRYSPIGKTHRKYVGKHWVRRQIRAVQLILNATHGIVSHQNKFFFHAFGQDIEAFNRILLYPFNYIINRVYHEEHTGNIPDLDEKIQKLSKNQINELKVLIGDGKVENVPHTKSGRLNAVLEHFEGENVAVIPKDQWSK